MIIRRILLIGSLITAIAVSVLVFQTWFCSMTFDDGNRIRMFHNEPADSMDMVIVGSSDAHSGFSSALAYKQDGIKSYPYTVDGETCLLWEAMVEDILRTQSPDVILIETYGATYPEMHFEKHNETIEASAYKLLDTFPTTPSKLKYSIKIAKYIDNSDALSFFVPFIKYHGRYGDYVENFKNQLYLHKTKTSPLKGILTKTAKCHKKKLIDLSTVDEVHELAETEEKNLREFIEYCKTIDDTKIVFIHFPVLAKEEGSFKYRGHTKAMMVGKIAEENGFDFINLQGMTGEMGITQGDFSDSGHMNIYGQRKLTAAICEILKEKYGVPVKGKHKTPDDDQEWKESAKFYDKYYDYADAAIKAGDKMKLADNQETIEKVKRGYNK